MDQQNGPTGNEPRGGSRMAWAISLFLAIFIVGLLGSPWLEAQLRGALPGFNALPGSPARLDDRQDAADRRIRALEQQMAALKAAPKANAGVAAAADSTELARLEERLANLGTLRTQDDQRIDYLTAEVARVATRVDETQRNTNASIAAAASGAERAQAVLLITTVRRALETGQPLGALEASLRQTFDTAPPATLDAVQRLAQTPASLPLLQQQLTRLAPALAVQTDSNSSQTGLWAQMQSALSDMVVLRRSDTTRAPDTASLLTRAEGRLERGDVAGAITVVRQMPIAVQRRAGNWLAAAQRHVAGMKALADLEQIALAPAAPAIAPRADASVAATPAI